MAPLTVHWEKCTNRFRQWTIPVLLGIVTEMIGAVAGIAVTGPASVHETAIVVGDILW
jgi:hypothetical protein